MTEFIKKNCVQKQLTFHFVFLALTGGREIQRWWKQTVAAGTTRRQRAANRVTTRQLEDGNNGKILFQTLIILFNYDAK